ncbi:hypothetical protein T484DRAFT_1885226 [Baffinella frigidus]|nr:hypothetical protein T484DRAFT_1885226 [Cryptophyta sp. CCMP2293]
MATHPTSPSSLLTAFSTLCGGAQVKAIAASQPHKRPHRPPALQIESLGIKKPDTKKPNTPAVSASDKAHRASFLYRGEFACAVKEWHWWRVAN